MMRTLLCIAILLAFITLGYDIAYTLSSGAPPGHTGAPLEGTCLDCHSSNFALNAGPEVPQISIVGNPTQYNASQTYSVTVSFTSTSRPRHGFSMVALTASNQNAGIWGLVSPANTQIVGSGGISYVTHTTTGNSQSSWTFNWTAPATNVGTVTIYAAFNAADASNDNTGDNIYTRSYSLDFNSTVPNSISTTVTGTSFCAGAPVSVGFTAAGTYTAGNVFTAQLSNSTGSFATPTNIGTLAGISSGTIAATIPVGATAGTGYRIRVIASSPATTGTANTSNLSINLVPAAPVASNNGPNCAGSTLQLSATTVAGATYSWVGPASFTSTLQNPTRANVLTAHAGTYTVYALANGCTSVAATTTVTINAAPATPVATNNGPICAGSTLQLNTPAVASATYSWVGPNSFTSTAQSPSITNATAAASGTYTVYVTANGCTSAAGTTAATVTATPATPAVTNPGSVCEGQTLTLTATSVASGTYTWSGPNSFSATGNILSISNATTAASGNYTLTGSVSGCSFSQSVHTVTVTPAPATPVAAGNDVCEGQSLNLTATGAPGATFSWTGPNNFSASGPTASIPNVTAAASGTYSVTQTVNNCTSLLPGTIAITVNPLPAIAVSPATATVCTGQSVELTASGALTYTWTPSAGLNTTTGAIVTATPAASSVYTVAGLSAQGCASATTVSVDVAATLTVTATASLPDLCEGQSTNLTATGAATYSWSTGETGDIISVSPTATTQYTVTGSSGTCSSTGTVQVTVNPVPVVSIAASGTAVCAGSSASLTASGGTDYSWSSGQTSAIISVSPTANTTYTVTGTTAGCSHDTTVTISVNPLPVVSFSGLLSNHCSNFNQTSTLTGNPAGGVFSGTGVTGNVFNSTALQMGNYTVTYTFTDVNSCVGIDSQQTFVAICGGISSAGKGTLKLYPNPSAGTIIIDPGNDNGQEFTLMLMNSMGQLVWQSQHSSTAETISVKLPEHIANGLYQVSFYSDKHMQTAPLQLQR